MSRENESNGRHAKHVNSEGAPYPSAAADAGRTVQMNAVGGSGNGGYQAGPQAGQGGWAQGEGAFRSAASGYGAQTYGTGPYDNAAAYASAEASRSKKSTAKVVGIIVAIVLAIYLVGVGVFSNMFYPNTRFDGNDLSFKNASYLAGLIDDSASDYTVNVAGDGVNFVVTSDQAGVSIDADAAAAQALAGNHAFAWPVEIFKSHDVAGDLQANYNESSLQQVVAAQVGAFNETATDPVNASIAYSSDAGAFQVTPEQAGTKLDADAVTAAVEKGVSEMADTVQLDANSLVQPTVLSDNAQLQQAASTANTYLGANIELVLGTTAIHAATVNADQISKWVTVGDDLSVTFDSNAMESWVKDLAASIDTVGTSRTFKSTNDGTITVSGGTYGWTVDEDKLISQVEDAVTNGTQGQLTVPTKGEGYTWAGQGNADWGAYAEIDISDQHAWFYDENGNLQWDSDIVTGKPGYDTPTGVWKILNKAQDYTLTGDISVATGQPEYRTKVAYWMPFTYDGCGFHDATWQSAFGGTRYLDGYGSHGCANLPLDKAQSLYGLIQTGNAVIVHA